MISLVGTAQKTSDKATLEDYLKLAEQNKEAGDVKEATRFLNEAATLVWEQKKYDEAIRYFNESITLNQEINNQSGISKIESNLGMIYSDKQQYDESLKHFQQSLVYRNKAGTKPEIISCRINIAVVLNNLKRYDEAVQNLEVALELATEMNDAAQMKSCYGMLAETYEKAGNEERTIHYFNLYRTFHEMLQRKVVKQAKQEIEEAQLQALQAELERKEKELELLRASKELEKVELQLSEISTEAKSLIDNNTKQQLAINLLERESQINEYKITQAESVQRQQQLIVTVVGIALLATSVIVVILFVNYRNKKRLVAQLNEQAEKIHSLEGKHKHHKEEIKSIS